MDLDEEPWLRAFEAQLTIVCDLKLSLEEAEFTMAQACESGEVRLRHRNLFGVTEFVSPDTLHPRLMEFDLLGRTLRCGECRIYGGKFCNLVIYQDVEVSGDDLRRLIAEQKRQEAVETWLKKPKKASKTMIDEAITRINDAAAAAGNRIPNLNELYPLVREHLKATRHRVSRQLVRQVANAPKHKDRRRPRGKTVRSERVERK
jgi:hypothetical protein